jgi:LPXTG-motif cell wall-anchored protein
VEIVRFGLLLTMTVALISVAIRYDDHGHSRNQAARGRHPGATATPSAGGTNGPGKTSPTPSAATGSGDGTGTGGNGSNGSGTGGSGTGGSGTGGSGTGGSGTGESVATLPRTGGTQAIELAALAALFIAAGSFSVRISKTRPRFGQVAGSTAAAAQPPQALGSSESNRPGTV